MTPTTDELVKRLRASREASKEHEFDPEVMEATALADQPLVEGEDTGVESMPIDEAQGTAEYENSPEIQEAIRRISEASVPSPSMEAPVINPPEDTLEPNMDDMRREEDMYDSQKSIDPMDGLEEAYKNYPSAEEAWGQPEIVIPSPEENPEADASYDALEGISRENERDMLKRLQGTK